MTERPSDDGESVNGSEESDEFGTDRRDPLEDLARDIEGRKRASERVDMFDRLDTGDVDDIDADRVWDDLSTEPDSVDETEDVGPTPVDSDGGDEYLVPKRSFCQQCEFFSAPPQVRCAHAGTEIVGIADTERFRVRNCPLVDDDALVGAERSLTAESDPVDSVADE